MVRLAEVIRALESPEEFICFYDRENDTIRCVNPSDDSPDVCEIRTSIEERRDRFVLLRKEPEFEMACMASFASSIRDPSLRGKLDSALSGRGAARAFRILILGTSLERPWKEFCDRCFVEAARHWGRTNLVRIEDL